ncbi:NAD(P)-binding protein [Hyaloscypha variabilis]
MTFNRIAVYGHRGWASSAIVNALAASGAPIKVLYRPSSDVSELPPSVTTICVDVEDQKALVSALQDTDIVISLVGHEGVRRQLAFVKAIPKTSVKLFVPSDLGFRVDEQGQQIPVFKNKDEVEKAAKDADIPTTLIWPGGMAESTLSMGLLGVDYTGNRIIFTGDSRHQPMNICTRKYVAAAYADIFASTPPSQLQDRAIGLSELKATGQQIYEALRKKHGAEPQTFTHSLEKVDTEISKELERGSPLAAVWWYRRVWGAGQNVPNVGRDIWEVDGYPKVTLDELLVEGKIQPYREVPPQLIGAVSATFH